MGKRIRGLIVVSLASAAAGASAVTAGYLYRLVCEPRKRSDNDFDQRTMEGRRFVRNCDRRRDVYINAIDNIRLYAAYISAEQESHSYAIIVHGIWDNCEGVGCLAKEYLAKGMNVLLPDLRAHGRSEGKYIGYGYDDRFDIMEWIYWILRQDRDARIMLHGVSMGAATVLMTTGENLPGNVRLAISDSSYTRTTDQLSKAYEGMAGSSIMPFRIALGLVRLETLVRAGYDINKAAPVEAVKRSHTPTIFLHGDSDKFVDPSMCAALYQAAACEKRYSLILGADHAEGVFVDHDRYWAKIDEAIKQYMD